MSEFDQRLIEEHSVNRLEESLALFKTVIEMQWFREASVILFLNKKDLLEEKISHSRLADYFPDFAGPECDHEAAREFILGMFLAVVERRKRVYPYYTCATGEQ